VLASNTIAERAVEVHGAIEIADSVNDDDLASAGWQKARV
jgi:hypothetical protein